MSDDVIAVAILRTSDGKSVADLEQPITPDIAKHIKIDETRRQQARQRVQACGLKVVSTGPFSLSFSTDKESFERIFKCRLRQVEPEPHLSATKPVYRAEGSIIIPADLTEYVAAVTLPSPPELFT